MEFSPESTILKPGDGGYRIMERMGIPQEHWHDVWQKAGPELAGIETNSGTPFGYQMSGQYSGEWGVRMTSDGKVPDEALKLIAQTHEDMYGNLPSGVEMTQAEVATKEVTPTPIEVTPEQTQALEQVIKSGGTISPATIAEHSTAFEGWQDVARGMTGEAFAGTMGMPTAVWTESVAPFIEEQLQAGNRMYTNTFSLVGDQIQLQVNRIPDQVMADMLNQVPALTRSSFTLAA
jgi:hypothetical protein